MTTQGWMARSPYYPDDIPLSAYCEMEGCVGKGNCPRCGTINYHLMGWYGAVARWAKAWGVSEEEAEKRIIEHQYAAEGFCPTCGHEAHEGECKDMLP